MTWRVSKSLVQLSQELRDRHPGVTIWRVGDAAHCGGPNPTSDHCPQTAPRGIVNAIDVVGRDIAARLWNELLQSRDPRIKYMIFNGQIVSSKVSPWQVRRYTGANPHANHIHISARSLPRFYDDGTPWLEGEDMTPEQEQLLRQVATDLADVKRSLAGRNIGNDLRRLRISGRSLALEAGVPVDLSGPDDGTVWIA